ncbi:accessory gene regulator B [Paenibacillus sp. PastF-1]|nr:accessory gene regulator B [Paenibacillus sp. PastF-2]MDF9847041.1 accessory gene regulator B [Paenibacillus sp. PastM-2]MDF9853613.1 accessory gene regulator B [Paenibacillus sp. PastF-1]MDH6478901.1 accessory gene regulator B [Paenibacillus sp. PastH-2]MDH6506633.1 accessory gene regulator B [Paenibacillus sp. PastM-3]
MNTIPNRIAVAIKRANPEETSSVEVMQYSLGIILNTLFIIIATATVGLLTGHFGKFMTFLLSCSILRLTSGGFHLKTARACNLFSIGLCTLIPYLFSFSGMTLTIINIISLLIMLLFAPNPDKNARMPLRIYPLLKLLSVLLVILNFFIHSSVIGLAFIVQSLTVIPWIRREKQ